MTTLKISIALLVSVAFFSSFTLVSKGKDSKSNVGAFTLKNTTNRLIDGYFEKDSEIIENITLDRGESFSSSTLLYRMPVDLDLSITDEDGCGNCYDSHSLYLSIEEAGNYYFVETSPGRFNLSQEEPEDSFDTNTSQAFKIHNNTDSFVYGSFMESDGTRRRFVVSPVGTGVNSSLEEVVLPAELTIEIGGHEYGPYGVDGESLFQERISSGNKHFMLSVHNNKITIRK